MESLSLCMIVKNEEKYIARCLESVVGLVNEIIIVDTGSTDRTKEIASKFGARIYDFTWNGNFSDARNYALKQSTGSWNFVLDADEYIVNDCKKELFHFINTEKAIGRIEVRSRFVKDQEEEYAKAYISRVFPAGITYHGRIHEQLNSQLPRKVIPVIVEHDGYYLTDKSERNIPLLLEEIQKNQTNPYFMYQLAKEYKGAQNIKAALKYFEKSYNLLKGHESYYASLVVNYLYTLKDGLDLNRAHQIIKENDTRLRQVPDFHFVKALLYMELAISDIEKYIHLIPEIEKCYLTCIELGENHEYDGVIGTGSYAALYNLGVYYEMIGSTNKAYDCYLRSAQYHYKPALRRLEKLQSNA